jgi:hypothetical protein
MHLSSPVTAVVQASGANPNGHQELSATEFTAVLRVIANECESQSVRASVVRQVSPAPVLCPRPDSLVRLIPLMGTFDPVQEAPGSVWINDDAWTFLDFAAFDGADFAYAVYRCLLHTAPSKRQVAAVESGSLEKRLMLLLSVDRKARRVVGGGRLINLGATRLLYRAYRTARKLKLGPIAELLRKYIGARARSLFEGQRDAIVQRRWMLRLLSTLSVRR